MNILGLNQGHDAGAAIVIDGKLLAAAEEERFLRRRHIAAFPHRAIAYCLQSCDLEMGDIDYIAIPWFGVNRHSPFLEQYRAIRKLGGLRSRLLPQLALSKLPPRRLDPTGGIGYWVDYGGGLNELRTYSNLPPVKYVDHHRAHAASAFYASGFEEAAVVSIDGGGYFYSTAIWHGTEGRLEMIRTEPVSNSAGVFLQLSQFLNFGSFGSGKVMGLSSYGRPDPELSLRVRQHVFTAEDGAWYKDKLFSPRSRRNIAASGIGLLPRTNEPALQAPYPDLAYAIQRELETAYLNVARDALRSSGSRNLCLAGGVALNCLANAHIWESGLVDNLFVFPAADDGGTPLGAALSVAAELGEPVAFPMTHAYWGPESSPQEIERSLVNSGLTFRREPDIAATIAQYLVEDRVVAWFQGRMELGPRALGNRSILANPRHAHNWQKVNLIKRREEWRPFGPSILDEHKADYFENACSSPFMCLSFQVKADKAALVPAIVHVDGSTRPQTVERSANPKLWRLIDQFFQRSGVPMVLNTSFNIQGPIVCSPQDAIDCFRESLLDCLVLGDFLVERPIKARAD